MSGKTSLLRRVVSIAFTAVLIVFVLEVVVPGKKEERPFVLVLKHFGVWKPVDNTAQSMLTAIDKHVKNFPDYYESVRSYLQPYGKLLSDVWIIASKGLHEFSGYARVKWLIVCDFIELYIPGLVDSIQNIWSLIYDAVCTQVQRSKRYLSEQVFVGEWSPENLQKKAIRGAYATKDYAWEGMAHLHAVFKQYTGAAPAPPKPKQ